ncbi:hypothetical protein ABZ725_14205 [Streptomyces sp. NPDC006872]|uniref:hypothetical protein n=1 Tax=Streptomyces sp. NPDC006872 TaxID=3155720 RepID=UPI0033E53BB5
MFKTTDTRRIRLKGGARVHDVVPHSRPMKTACGKSIRLFDARGRVLDRPLSDTTEITVTCRACIRVTTPPA